MDQVECIAESNIDFLPGDPLYRFQLFNKIAFLYLCATEDKDLKSSGFLEVLISYHGLSKTTIAKMTGVKIVDVMKKAPMIILLLAPYIFLLIDIGICVEENGFTADAIEMIGWTFMGMFLLILFPNMIYAFILKRCGYGYQKLFFWNLPVFICF